MPDERAVVSLYLYGDALVPEEITQAIKAAPDRSLRRGEKKPSRLESSTAVAKTGLWMIRAEPAAGFVSEQLASLIRRIASWPGSLINLPHVTDARIDIYLQANTPESSVGFEISRDLINELSVRGLRVSLTLDIGDDE